jgi:hypothetical protein
MRSNAVYAVFTEFGVFFLDTMRHRIFDYYCSFDPGRIGLNVDLIER